MDIKQNVVHVRVTEILHEFLTVKAKGLEISRSTLCRFLLEKSVDEELGLFIKKRAKKKKKK